MKRDRTRQKAVVIGFDSETLYGPPITLQFYSDDCKRVNSCVFIGKRNAVDVFLKQLKRLPPGRYRMYGHNLEFDMLSALWEVRTQIRDGDINLQIGDWHIVGRYSKPIFAEFDDGERYVELVDSFLWFMTSLEKAMEKVCPHIPKLPRPRGLGITLYTPKDIEFVEYAMRDAVGAYHLGCAIERFHAELKIPSQISLASMAAAVFRINYMRSNIYQPPLYEWMAGAAAAYHGGVNRVFPGAAPSWHTNVTALDLSSAYPDAMQRFPDFSDGNGYKKYKRAKAVKEVPELGVYKVSGTAAKCNWPAMFDHDFKPLQGTFSNIWICGKEVNAALEYRELKLTSIEGYFYQSKRSSYSPFAGYVDDFYDLKSTAKDPVMRYMYKILLNSLTGKFIQTSPDYTLVDGQLVKIKRAGGLYHPFIAGQITADCRAHIHEVEHDVKALHTATDGVFAPGKLEGAKEKKLGAVVAEGFGDLALFRNKLYIFYTKKETEDTYPSQVFKDRHILKCARHGFQGRVVDLEMMLVSDKRTYNVNKPIKLKTAIKKNEAPNKFVISERTLRNIDTFKVQEHEK